MKMEVTEKEALEVLNRRHMGTYTKKLIGIPVLCFIAAALFAYFSNKVLADWLQVFIMVALFIPVFVYLHRVVSRVSRATQEELKALKKVE